MELTVSPAPHIHDNLTVSKCMYNVIIALLGCIREFLGTGHVFGISVYPEEYGSLIFILAPGAFIALGFLIAIIHTLKTR